MFTGLIEDIGKVSAIRSGPTTRLEIETAFDLADVALGESIAIDGCCLTVVEKKARAIAFEATAETLRRTTLESYAPGTRVNLERAMALGERLGGHLVLGHVDATSSILRTWQEGAALGIEIALPAQLAAYFIEKGSVAVDGVSLTVNRLSEKSFELMLIPETRMRTTLGAKAAGSRVNLEADLIGKYVERMMSVRNASAGALTAEAIAAAGFGRKP
jgi:riboflavin synthase